MICSICIHPIRIPQRITLQEPPEIRVKHPIAILYQPGLLIPPQPLEKVDPVVAASRLHSPRRGQERHGAVGRVAVPLIHVAGGVHDRDDVEPPVAQGVVPGRRGEDGAVAADQVVDVAQAPDELADHARGAGLDLFDALPTGGVVEVEGVFERAGVVVGQLADAEVSRVVGVLGDLRPARNLIQCDQAVPGVVLRGEPGRGVFRLRERSGIPRNVVRGLDPRGTRRVGDIGDLVDLVVVAGLDQLVGAVAIIVLGEVGPVGDLVQRPVLLEVQPPGSDGRVAGVEQAASLLRSQQ